MADKELGSLTSATTLDGTETHYVVQGGNSRKTTGAAIVAITHNQAWSTITSTPTTLSGYGITDAQPLDSDLTAIAGLTTTGFGRGFLEFADEAAFKAGVNLEIGTDVQAHDALLDAIAALTTASGDIVYATGADAVAALGIGVSGQVLKVGATGLPEWGAAAGGGDMLASVYDPTSVSGDAFDMGNMVEATDAKIMTAAERTKLTGVEAGADVTDATNVDAAGATMNTDTDVSGNSWVLDEDDMASDSATKVPTQQSVKAYVDALGFSAPVADTFLRANADATGYDALTAAQAWSALADENVFNQAKSAPPKFWSNVHPGAKIHRMNDRILLGQATDSEGVAPDTQVDKMSAYRVGTVNISQFASVSTIGTVGVFGGSFSSDSDIAGGMGTIGGMFFGINDNADTVQTAYAAYGEAHRLAGAGTAHAFEFDTVNFGDVVSIDPYQMFLPGLTSGAWLASGGGVNGADPRYPGVQDSSVAIGIVSAPTKYDKGIVFHKNALVGADGTGAAGIAIEMAAGHTIRWARAAAAFGFEIRSTVQTAAGRSLLLADDNGLALQNNVAANLFRVSVDQSAVNGITVTPGAAGVAAMVSASGSDLNVDLKLAAKGTGKIQLGTTATAATTPGSFTANNYIVLKDATGATVYVPCRASAW